MNGRHDQSPSDGWDAACSMGESEHVQGVEASEIELRLVSDERSREQLFADIRARLATVSGLSFTVGQPISHRIDHMISGQRSAMSIKVIGSDLPALRRYAQRVSDVASAVPGLVDVQVEQAIDVPQIWVRVDEQAVAAYGWTPGEAAQTISTALWGTVAGVIHEDGISTDIVVRYADELHSSLEAISAARLIAPSGAMVPISAVAELRHDFGPNYIMRENVERRVAVTANVADRGLRSAYEDLRARIESEIELPPQLRIEYAGQFEREAAASRRLAIFGTVAIFGIALIVVATLGSVRRTLIV